MRKKVLKILIVLLLFITAGCWDSIDIDEQNIVTAVIIDRTTDGFTFIIEIAPPSPQMTGSEGTPQGGSQKNIIMKAEGKTFAEARANSDRISDKNMYLGGDQIVAFTMPMAEYGIREYAYRLREIPEYRKTVDVITTEENPEELLHAKTEHQDQVGISISDTLDELERRGNALRSPLSDLLENLASPYPCHLMPIINLKEEQAKLAGYAVFFGDKIHGKIPITEAEGLMQFRAKIMKGAFVIPFREYQLTIKTTDGKRKIRPLYQNGKISLTFEYQCLAQIDYTDRMFRITDQVAKDIEKTIAGYLKELFEATVSFSQKELQLDYLGFFTAFRIRYPDVVKRLDWNTVYPDAEVKIDVRVHFDPSGKIDYRQ